MVIVFAFLRRVATQSMAEIESDRHALLPTPTPREVIRKQDEDPVCFSPRSLNCSVFYLSFFRDSNFKSPALDSLGPFSFLGNALRNVRFFFLFFHPVAYLSTLTRRLSQYCPDRAKHLSERMKREMKTQF